jgi:2-succinyl-5-enolpyruvyl-6-hydroxy-3-cyclohexene-1-carboxylate synthase
MEACRASQSAISNFMNIANLNYLHASVLLHTFAELGVRHVVISPGSRSTPLARTAYLSDQFECDVILDERAAAFFALGCAKVDNRPAILICTSGTAGANYYPAVIEAAQSFTPLIVLTADRPAAVRHRGAMQTIDQEMLFGKFAKYFTDIPEPAATLEHARALREIALAAWRSAMSEPRGVAHLNIPLDEPLVPIERDAAQCTSIYAAVSSETLPPIALASPAMPVKTVIESIVARLRDSLCGLIVAGPGTARNAVEAEVIHRFARQLGWPLLADVVSGLRQMPNPVFPYYDLFLREESLTSLAPDLVIEFGACPTSKILNQYLDRHRAVHTIRIQPHGVVQDPSFRADETIIAPVAELCSVLAGKVEVSRDSLLYDPFQRVSGLLRSRVIAHARSNMISESMVVHAAMNAMPEGANLVLASSLSLRYADMLAANEGRSVHVFAQRGTNGIDGTIAHASGVATASETPTLLITGDLAFCHDLGSFAVARKLAKKLTILLFNNNGGGIFHLVPAVKYQDTFEQLHGVPQDLNLEGCAQVFDLDWQKASTPDEVRRLIQDEKRDRLRVVEFVSSRQETALRLKEFAADMIGVLR